MKLFKKGPLTLTRTQWKKIFLATSIMTIVLYLVAMVFSLCGSKYFILNYQNEQMDRIESWFRSNDIMAIINLIYVAIESSIVLSFSQNKLVRWYQPLALYGVNIILAFIFKNSFQMIFTISQIVLCGIFLVIETFVYHKEDRKKFVLLSLLRIAIAMAVTFILQVMIYVIKAGYFSVDNHIQTLSSAFIYSIEYDIALLVILFTISLYINREKGDSEPWVTAHNPGGSSQTSTTRLQKSSQMNLTKTQKNKLRLLYLRVMFTQLFGFLLLMVLPFLLGKVFEFLVMYTAFAIARYILGFKYSLHFKKESICITVGVIVFGILSLAVPFFTVLVILAVTLGVALAILLHLSYKYKGMWLFTQISKPDKFAELYVLMDGDLTPHHVKITCIARGLEVDETNVITLFAEGNKKSYIANKLNYSEKTIERKINEALEKLSHTT